MPTFHLVDDPQRLDEVAGRIRDRNGARSTHVAVIGSYDDAAAAVLAALSGADLVLACTAEEEVVDALVDDLQHLGTVEHAVAAEVRVTAEHVALLARLAAGDSLGEAATALHLSRRTADRRLAAARAALGVRTTAEALTAAARLGLLD